MPSPAKIRRDESTRAKIPARSFKCINKSIFLYLNVYVFGSGSPVEYWIPGTVRRNGRRFRVHNYSSR